MAALGGSAPDPSSNRFVPASAAAAPRPATPGMRGLPWLAGAAAAPPPSCPRRMGHPLLPPWGAGNGDSAAWGGAAGSGRARGAAGRLHGGPMVKGARVHARPAGPTGRSQALTGAAAAATRDGPAPFAPLAGGLAGLSRPRVRGQPKEAGRLEGALQGL